jgi:hypothetical protein
MRNLKSLSTTIAIAAAALALLNVDVYAQNTPQITLAHNVISAEDSTMDDRTRNALLAKLVETRELEAMALNCQLSGGGTTSTGAVVEHTTR